MKNCHIIIEKSKIEEYKNKKFATINPDDVSKIVINGEVVKNKMQDGIEYVTILSNIGGAFSQEWAKSDIKIPFILRESYILYDSFINGDFGGHDKIKEYTEGDDWKENLWENVTYRNMVKITYLTYLMKIGEISEIINDDIAGEFKRIFSEKWNEACEIFIKHAAVISANPFPALAFSSTRTDQSLLNKWLSIPEIKSMLQEEVKEFNPKCVYGAFDLGSVSSYEDLFGWFKGKKLEELVVQDGEQDIIGRRVTSGGKYDKFTFATDEFNVKWIQGVHPSSRLSHEKMLQIALLAQGLKNK